MSLSFQYTMTDNHGASDVATVTFTVLGQGRDTRDVDDEDPATDDFPIWLQDISNITLVFNQREGDTKPLSGGDGYYTVKINVDSAFPDDLDVSIGTLLQALADLDPFIDESSDLLGVVIKGGLQTTQYYAYGEHNTNGTAADVLPDDLGFDLTGTSSNVNPVNAIDAAYSYSALILS